MKHSCIIFCFSLFIRVNPLLLNREEGDKCKHLNGEDGTCQLIDNCPQIGDFKKSRPDICGFMDKIPIICCPPRHDFSPPIPVEGRKPDIDMSVSILNPQHSCGDGMNTAYAIPDHTSQQNSTNKPPFSIIKCVEYEVSLCQLSVLQTGKTQVSEQPELNGTVTNREQFPFMVAVGYGDKHNIKWGCSASVISDRWILSSAQCAYTVFGDAKWAGLSFMRLTPKFDGVALRINKTVVHPSFSPPSMYHDIALFQLGDTLGFNNVARPNCLHPLKALPNKATAIGWPTSSIGKDRQMMQFMETRIQPSHVCHRVYNDSKLLPRGFDDEIMFCAGDINTGVSVSDRGGPIFHKSTICLHVQFGLFSTCLDCDSSPSLYTRISYYIPWIESIVWPS